MSEQCANVRERFHSPRIPLLSVIFACILVTLTACVPTGQENVNTELFKDKTDIVERMNALRPGMSEKAVFQKLGIESARFERMSMPEVQLSMYGNSQVRGTPAQLEQFHRKLMSCKGYALPYRKIGSSSSLGFGKMKIKKTGQDLRLVVVFSGGRLARSAIEGTEAVKIEEEQYFWDKLIKSGIGLAF